MKNVKNENAITLIALAVIIVIILILAAIAIESISNDGMLGYIKNATKDYNESVGNEQEILNDGDEEPSNSSDGETGNNETPTKGPWIQNQTTVTNGTITLEVGKTVTGYDAGVNNYKRGWAILGAEDGKLLLVSKENVKNVELSGTDAYNNNAENSTNEKSLNAQCQLYKDEEFAEKTRSINVEDINRITGYNPETQAYGEGKIYKYGGKVTYTKNTNGFIEFKSTSMTEKVTTSYNYFKGIDEKELGETGSSNEVTITSTYYNYNCSNMLENVEPRAKAIEILFNEDGNNENSYYWLASQHVTNQEGFVYYGVRVMAKGVVSGENFWSTFHGGNTSTRGLRVVVVLDENVGITSSGVLSMLSE